MLPSKGQCLGVFLLLRTAALKPRNNADEWIDAARGNSSFMAMSLDLDKIAQALLSMNLVSATPNVVLSEKLASFTEIADRATLLGIAKILLIARPPLWLKLAVDGDTINREYIPSSDVDELDWLSDDFDLLLIEVGRILYSSERDLFLKRLGDAAELFIFSSLTFAGKRPLHVAKISDSYGYDIECGTPSIERFEIKASSENTSGRFRISRNEFEKSLHYGSQWRVLQVVFANRAFLSHVINKSHVIGVFQLPSSTLSKLVAKDTSSFRWMDTAEITTEREHWIPFEFEPEPGFELPGFRGN